MSGRHWNTASRTPPVDTPLVILLPDGDEVRCERKHWAGSHNDLLEFHKLDGTVVVGRFPWTYP